MELEKRAAQEADKIENLYREKNFKSLYQWFEPYFKKQLSADFVGREDFSGIFRFYHPILIELEDSLFEKAVMTLFYTEHIGKAKRLLDIRRQKALWNETLEALDSDILQFRNAIDAFEQGNVTLAEKSAAFLLEKYPAHPSFCKLDIRLRFAAVDVASVPDSTIQVLEEYRNTFPGDSFFEKYEADLLLAEGKQTEALQIYGTILKETSNGIILHEDDKTCRNLLNEQLKDMLRELAAGHPQKAEALVNTWLMVYESDPRLWQMKFVTVYNLADSLDDYMQLMRDIRNYIKKTKPVDRQVPEGFQPDLAVLVKNLLRKLGYSEEGTDLYCRIHLPKDLIPYRRDPQSICRDLEKVMNSAERRKLQADLYKKEGKTVSAFELYLNVLKEEAPFPFLQEEVRDAVLEDLFSTSKLYRQYRKSHRILWEKQADFWFAKFRTMTDIQLVNHFFIDPDTGL